MGDLIIETKGPWKSKSGGELMVLSAIPYNDLLKDLLNYNPTELEKIPSDIRGVRIYTVRGIPVNAIGGTESHKIRKEFIFVLEGKIEITLEGLDGRIGTSIITPNQGVYVPPFTLHTYKSLEEHSGLLVICNTLFIPEDPRTHDTYNVEEFRKLQSAS